MACLKLVIYLTFIFGFASYCYSQSADTNTIKLPDGWTSGDVKANGITLHYYRTGNGSLPPMVLSHGYTDNGLCWTDLALAIEKKYDVIMYDLRGHGLSDAPPTGYTIENNVSDIVGLIRAQLPGELEPQGDPIDADDRACSDDLSCHDRCQADRAHTENGDACPGGDRQ